MIGEVHRIEKVIKGTLKEAKWYRIAKISETSAYAKTMLIGLNSAYDYINNSSILLSINITYKKAKITCISGLENYKVFTKVRVVEDTSDNNFYVELYYSVDKANTVRVSLCDLSGIDKVTMLDFKDTTSTITELGDYTISTDTGWKDLTFKTGWRSAGGKTACGCRRIGNEVFLKGLVTNDGSSERDCVQLATDFFNNNKDFVFASITNSNSIALVQIGSNGIIRAPAGLTKGQWFSLDGISFLIN